MALAFAQLFSAPILRLLGWCVLLSLAALVGLWFAADFALRHWLPDGWAFGMRPMGGLAAILVAVLLFPAVVSALVGIFLDHVAALVERRHYPALAVAEGLPLLAGVFASLRFLVVVLGANLLLLVLMLFPPVYAVMWFVVNGWLAGREYLELVALRREPHRDAQSLRRTHHLECALIGVGLTALMLVPIANLIVPVFATMVMVHRYHDWRGSPGSRRAQAGGG